MLQLALTCRFWVRSLEIARPDAFRRDVSGSPACQPGVIGVIGVSAASGSCRRLIVRGVVADWAGLARRWRNTTVKGDLAPFDNRLLLPAPPPPPPRRLGVVRPSWADGRTR